jgi:hypothetical protein
MDASGIRLLGLPWWVATVPIGSVRSSFLNQAAIRCLEQRLHLHIPKSEQIFHWRFAGFEKAIRMEMSMKLAFSCIHGKHRRTQAQKWITCSISEDTDRDRIVRSGALVGVPVPVPFCAVILKWTVSNGRVAGSRLQDRERWVRRMSIGARSGGSVSHGVD